MSDEERKAFDELKAALEQMLDEKIAASENRTDEVIKSSVTDAVAASEKRTVELLKKQDKQVIFHEARIRNLEKSKPAPEKKQSEEKAVIKAPLEVPKQTFKSGDREFRFILPKFNMPGRGIVTAEEALRNQELLDELVKMEAGVIKELF